MTYNTYTRTGPFTNGAAPGVSASFLNALETFAAAGWFDSQITSNGAGILGALGLSINPTPVTVNGSLSGSATLYQLFNGSVKFVVVSHSNYRSAAAQTLVLPTAFSGNSYWWTTEYQGGKVEALSGGTGGTAQTFSVLTAIGISGGSQNPQTWLNGYSQGVCRSAFDTFRITNTGASAATGLTIILGI